MQSVQKQTKIKIYFVFAAGMISIFGDLFIRTTSNLFFLVVTGEMSLSWGDILLNTDWMALDLLAGVITGVVFGPFYVRKVIVLIENDGDWRTKGAWIGALAGFCNAIILAVIHLSIMAGPGMPWKTEAWTTVSFMLFQTYLPIVGVIMGFPAAGLGALAGIGGGLLIRKLIMQREKFNIN